jgi:hypothetical protein
MRETIIIIFLLLPKEVILIYIMLRSAIEEGAS